MIALAVLASGVMQRWDRQSRIKTALLSPDVDLRSLRSGEDLPTVLSAHDIGLYRDIFALQEDSNWDEADRLIADLRDPLLMGHALEQRFMHPTAYRSKYHELRDWLTRIRITRIPIASTALPCAASRAERRHQKRQSVENCWIRSLYPTIRTGLCVAAGSFSGCFGRGAARVTRHVRSLVQRGP